MPQKISVVIPAYNESEGILEFHKSLLLPGLKKATLPYQIIYVNDGSKDDTLKKLQKLARDDKAISVINLSRNFGKEIATTAGIFHATGNAVIVMDADGQHPPSLIADFVKEWKTGAQVVVGVRKKQKHEGFIKSVGSKAFYSLFNKMSGSHLTPRSTDFRLISKEVQQEFIKFSERNRITRGIIDWLGFKRAYIHFDSPERFAGTPSYKTSQLVKLATNSFVSLSLRPLFLFGWIGLFITIASLIAGLFIIVQQYILGDPLGLDITGSAMLGIFVSFMVGLVLISQGIMAVYMSHIHSQSQDRPLFVVDPIESVNL